MPNVFSLKVQSYRRHEASGQAVVRISGRNFCLGKDGSRVNLQHFKS